MSDGVCPVIETRSLLIDGTGGVYDKVEKSFQYITEVVLTMRFRSNGFDCEKFGNAPPLDNGFYLVYKGNHLGSENPIKANRYLHLYGYDIGMMEHPDPNNPPTLLQRIYGDYSRIIVICAKWRFKQWMFDGLGMWDAKDEFGIMVNDDMTNIPDLLDLKYTSLGWHPHP